MLRRISLSALAVLLLGVVLLGERTHHPPDRVLTWDVFGYYLYLPASFIYEDLEMEKEEVYQGLIEKYRTTETFYQVTTNDAGDKVMRYPMGWALIYSPFFFLAHGIALLSSYPADGLSPPYQYCIGYGGLVYALLGLYFFRRFLKHFFSDRLVAALILLVGLGTNYLHLTTSGSAMPHNHIFTLFAIFCWATHEWHRAPKKSLAFAIGLLGGMMVISRPSTLLVFLVPLFWGVTGIRSMERKLKEVLSKKGAHLALLIFGTFLPGFAQMLYWKVYAGAWIFYSYQDPSVGFDFLAPYTLQFLFSFRKGWLIYTPLAILFLVGFFYWKEKGERKGVLGAILIYFLVHLYLVSSWSCWWYAGGDYSQRAMLETYVLLALPFGALLERWSRAHRPVKWAGSALLLLLVSINLFHTWQFHQGIIHPTRMTFSYYLKIAGQTETKEEWKDLLLVKRPFKTDETMPAAYREEKELLAEQRFRDHRAPENEELPEEWQGNGKFPMGPEQIYSPAIKMPFKDITDERFAWLSIHARFRLLEAPKGRVHLVTTFKYQGKNYKYRTETLKKGSKGSVHHLRMDYMTPRVRTPSDLLRVYVWDEGKVKLLLDRVWIQKHYKEGKGKAQ